MRNETEGRGRNCKTKESRETIQRIQRDKVELIFTERNGGEEGEIDEKERVRSV